MHLMQFTHHFLNSGSEAGNLRSVMFKGDHGLQVKSMLTWLQELGFFWVLSYLTLCKKDKTKQKLESRLVSYTYLPLVTNVLFSQEKGGKHFELYRADL